MAEEHVDEIMYDQDPKRLPRGQGTREQKT